MKILKRIMTLGIMTAVIIAAFVGCGKKTGKTVKYTGISDEYAGKLFDTSYVHEINIEIAEEDWADLLANPTAKTKYEANVTIDGETFEKVSFATKGNTSLSSVASNADSDRYSFKINFGKYVEDQTYYGLNKLNLNNIYADATYMKDYISYEIFRAAGVDAPLTSYVNISINGEAFGLYIAIEEVGKSYIERVYDGEGELYKPETEQLNNIGNFGGGDNMQQQQPPEMPNMGNTDGTQQQQQPPEMPDMGNKGGFMDIGSGDEGASLAYTDDEISSYSAIFDNAVTKVDEADMLRVIEALKQLSEGEKLEECLDIDEVIKYFVAHNFVLNYDSYTGNMLHNYYLYENDGKLSMLPWDYNLAFGGFNSGDITQLLNTAIDTPLSGTDEESRPMWSWIAENEEYLAKYHEYFKKLIEEYFANGEFEKEIERVYEMIKPYVEKDASAFYTAEEFETAYATLKQFCMLRAESISKQLSGTLASVTEEQNAEDYVQPGNLAIADMGTHMGGGQGNMPGGFNGGEQGNMPGGFNGGEQGNVPGGFNGGGQGNAPGGFTGGQGNMPGGFTGGGQENAQDGFDSEQESMSDGKE